MSFLGWTFLFGAVAVVGPIVAHLLAKPRFRRVPFTMLPFLRVGRHESHSRRKLRDLLVLLLRCAIIALIAVLFARPVLKVPVAPPPHRSIHYLALDDSASMALADGRSSLFGRMIETAAGHIRRAPEDTTFAVYGLASGRFAQGLSKSQVFAELKRLTVVPKTARPADFVQAVRQAATSEDAVSATILSDFTPEVLGQFEQIRVPAGVDESSYEVIAPVLPASNAAVVEARAVEVVDGELELDVVVANYGGAPQRRRLAANCEGLRTVSADVAVAPGERRVVHLRMDLGPRPRGDAHACLPIEFHLEPADDLSADDVYRLAIWMPGRASTRILVVHRGDETFLFETAIQALAGQESAALLDLRKVPENRLRVDDIAGTDVIVFSSLPRDAACPILPLKSFLTRGGRLVFFVGDVGNLSVAERLLREGLIPALPQKWVQAIVSPEPRPVESGTASSESMAKSLANYRFDRIALKGHWVCRAAPETRCVWRLANGAGFVYAEARDAGSSILVNTSIDDSLGLLAKSGAWVAFCRFLVGEGDRLREFCFRVDERPVVDLPDALRTPGRTVVGIETCEGARGQAVVEGTRMVLPTLQSTGWMKTLGERRLCAGVNLPEGETDLRRPAEAAVADAMKRAFVMDSTREQVAAHAARPTESKPIWRAFAWATILLLLLEPAITNRLRR